VQCRFTSEPWFAFWEEAWRELSSPSPCAASHRHCEDIVLGLSLVPWCLRLRSGSFLALSAITCAPDVIARFCFEFHLVLRIAGVCHGVGFRDLGGGGDGERSFMRFRSDCE
jgi:hypothetical protein